MMGKAIQSTAAKNGYAKSRDFLSSLLGKEVEPTNISKMPGVTASINSKANTSPAGRVFAQTVGNATRAEAEKKSVLNAAMAEAQRLKDRQAHMKAQALKLKNSIEAAKRQGKRGVGKLEAQFQQMEDEYTAPAIDEAIKMAFGESDPEKVLGKYADGLGHAMENKAEILAARKQVQAAKSGQLKIPDGPLEAEVPNARIETLQQNLSRVKEETLGAEMDVQRFKNIDLDNVKKALKDSPAVDPRLQPFLKAGTPSEFLQALVSTNHENVATLRGQLSKPGVKALEETFSKHFAQLATGADGQLTGIEDATKAFPFDKVAAIYGGGMSGRLKAESIQTVVDDTRRMLDKSKRSTLGDGMTKRLAVATVGSIPYVLYRMSHSNAGYAAAEGAAIGATVAAVAFPKIIDQAVRSPAFGRQFHKWTQEGAIGDSLTAYPLVKQFFETANSASKPQ
jgi:hypothetical protein